MQFTLFRMFGAVCVVAIMAAGMAVRTRWWADGICTASILLYVFMLLRSIGLTKSERLFAITFSIVGGSYLIFATSAAFSPLRNSLPTNHALAALSVALRIPVNTEFQDITILSPTGQIDASATQNASLPGFENVLAFTAANGDVSTEFAAVPIGAFFLIGHCFFSMCLALMAGFYVCGAQHIAVFRPD